MGLKLKKSIFEDCSLRECDFSNGDFSGGNFQGSDFQGATFGKANLSKSDFTGATNISLNPKENILTDAKVPLTEALSMISALGVKVV